MASQIESRIEKLESNTSTGASSVTVVFEGDDRPLPASGTVIRVRFVKPGEHHADDHQAH